MSQMIFYVFLILLAACIGFAIPIIKKRFKIGKTFDSLESVATGVFLGAALIHLIPDAISSFHDQKPNINYPVIMLIVGAVFILFLLIEHSFAYYNHKKYHTTLNINNQEIDIEDEKKLTLSKTNTLILACSTTLALTLHSFFAGAGLGLANTRGLAVIMLIAILSHKTVAALALTIELYKTKSKTWVKIFLFLIFALATPLGLILGYTVKINFDNQIITPILIAFSGGTFLFLGTLHGLSKSVLGSKCCKVWNFLWVIVGFSIMALVAIWT